MIRLLLAILLLSLAGSALADPIVQVTLPDYGSYSYWLQARNGAVIAVPANVSNHQIITLRVPREEGNRLVLLDTATGQYAQQVLALSASGTVAPAVFTLGDFHPLGAAPSTVPAATSGTASPAAGSGISPALAAAVAAAAIGGGWLLWALGRRTAKQTPATLTVPRERDPGMILMPRHKVPAIEDTEMTRFDIVPDKDLQRGPIIPLARPATLVGVQGLVTGSTFALTAAEVTIGRDGENEIVLAENTVSRYHARLLRQENGQFALTDLSSANGVYINGTRVQRAILCSGDQIKVGDNFFRFQSNVDAS